MDTTIAPDSARYREAAPVTSKATQPAYPSRHFDYAGRTWRLYKRSHDPAAAWYFEFQLDGVKWGPKSLKTATWALAVEDAKLRIEAWRTRSREQLEVAMGRRERHVEPPKYSTFADLFAVIDQLDMQANPNSRRNYVWGCKRFFSYACGVPVDAVPALSLELVCAETVEQYVSKAVADLLKMQQGDQIRFKRTLRGWFLGAKTIFTPNSVSYMRKIGLSTHLDSKIEEFRRANVKRLAGSRGSEFIAPDQAILRATFRQWIKLGRTPGYAVRGGSGNTRRKLDLQPLHETARRNMFIAIGLMLAGGLRKGEVMQIRWRHLTRDAHGVPRLVARDVTVKNKSAKLEVKPLNPFWHILQKTIERNGWRGAPDDYVLAQREKVPAINHQHSTLNYFNGGHCDRTYWPYYHIGKWLRDLGWRLQKTNHALRDCAGSLVTMKFGLDRAKIFCRHATRATTESHYSRFVDEDLMDNPNRLAWLSWAK